MKRLILLSLALGLASFPSPWGTPLRASDHLDAPNLSGKGGLDVNDLYAFQSPNNPANTVLVLTVNPFAGNLSPTTFDPMVNYEFHVDNNGDAVADVKFSTMFTAADGSGTQGLTVRRADNSVYASGNTGGTIMTAGGAMVQAGLFDDPFFFDLNGFRNGLNFTGSDAFAGANISAIVLEVPSVDLGGANVGVWVTTSMGGAQVDRMGRPAINTVLIPSARKAEFNLGTPNNDRTVFGDDVLANITALSGNAGVAATLKDILLPDILTIDTSSSAGFLNGRRLADDVIDIELNVLTNGGLTTGDGVGANDVPFRAAFPYLAVANVPEPSASVLIVLGLAGSLRLRRRQ